MKNYGQDSVSDTIEFSKKGPKIKKVLDDLFGAYQNDEIALSRVQGKDPVNAQDFVTKNFLEAFAQKEISYAYATNTDITTNINDDAGNFISDVPLFGDAVVDETGAFTFLNATQIRCNFDGLILNFVNVHITSNTQITSVNIRMKKNGTPINGVGATGYIGATNQHNESSLHISGPIPVANGDILSVGRKQEASSGTVFMSELNTSNITILRLR